MSVIAQSALPYFRETLQRLYPGARLIADVREFLYETTMLGMPLRRVHGNIDDCDPQVVQWLTGSVDHAPDEEVQEEEKEDDIDPRWAALKGLTSEEEKEGGEPN